MTQFVSIDTITQLHTMLGIEKPKHPLISLLPIDEKIRSYDIGDATYVFGFYQISIKVGLACKITYGRNNYDFDDGTMLFSKPGQAMSYSVNRELADVDHEPPGWLLMFHPDLLRGSSLGNSMEQYSFFSYDACEALHLSEQERLSIEMLTQQIEHEYNQSIDRYTQQLIVSNLELILNYCTRYYDRQFYLRSNLNRDFVSRFDQLLSDYFNSEQPLEKGIISVKRCGEALNMSPSYLSDMLKKETGRTAQQAIQDYVIERAKNHLLASDEQVNQIAYSLGFEYPQHFSKMFKARTGVSPGEFRRVH